MELLELFACRGWRSAIRTSFRAGSASGSRLPGRWLQTSVLLLDEPFGAVDAKIRQELREWLVTLHNELNVTTIFGTHDQEEALEVSNRIVIFSRGVLEQVWGTPREVYEFPPTSFGRFIGVMNVLELEVRDGLAGSMSLNFRPKGQPGSKLRIGFPALRDSIHLTLPPFGITPCCGILSSLGSSSRLELELPSGLILRSRMSKEEYAQHGLEDGKEISFQIKQYRVLAGETSTLPPERELDYQSPPSIAEHI
jgi:sulfate transport system ATP-binding protein